MKLSEKQKQKLDEAFASSGLRMTRQREQVMAVLLACKDHPSADLVYSRAKQTMPTISLATVYNCLETLVSCGLVRQINFQRQPSRYCPVVDNDTHFAHFHCQKTGEVFDLDLPEEVVDQLIRALPEGFEPEKMELCFSGKVREAEPA